MHRLQVDAAVAQARAPHLLPDLLGNVDELGRPAGRELEPVGGHLDAPSAPWRRWRVRGAGWSDAAAVETDSIARANATCTASGARSASRREPRARQRSPIKRVVG